jgi:hypothetical protein
MYLGVANSARETKKSCTDFVYLDSPSLFANMLMSSYTDRKEMSSALIIIHEKRPRHSLMTCGLPPSVKLRNFYLIKMIRASCVALSGRYSSIVLVMTLSPSILSFIRLLENYLSMTP